jgi:hypothetical protein
MVSFGHTQSDRANIDECSLYVQRRLLLSGRSKFEPAVDVASKCSRVWVFIE